MNNKDELKKLAFKVNDLLSDYIAVHNDRLKRGGTLMSLLKNLFGKKVDFKQILENSQVLLDKFQSLRTEFTNIRNERYENFNEEEKEFFDCLDDYLNSLHSTSKILSQLSQYQYSISQSASKGSWSEYKQLEDEYEESIRDYLVKGEKLNKIYNRLNY